MVSTETVTKCDVSDMGLVGHHFLTKLSLSNASLCVYPTCTDTFALSLVQFVGSLHISLACENKGCGVTCQRVCHILVEQIHRWKEHQPPSC